MDLLDRCNIFRLLGEEFAIHELIDYPPPYARTAYNLETLVKCIRSYLSQGHFEGDFDDWLENPVVPVVPPPDEAALPPWICSQVCSK